jgi:hypothetical protein
MTIYEYLMKAVQADARRAGERDRLVLEARRARRARRHRWVRAALGRRRTETGKIAVSENLTLGGVIQDPAGGEDFRAGGRAGNSPRRAKPALDEALAARAALRPGRRSYEWLAERWSSRQRQAGGQTEQPAQVRRVRDPRQSRLEQRDSPLGRRDASGVRRRQRSEMLAGAPPGQASGRETQEQQVARRRPQQ